MTFISNKQPIRLVWGASSVADGSNQKLHAGVANVSTTTSQEYSHTATRDGFLRTFYVHHDTTVSAGDLIYTVYVNDVATSITVTLDTNDQGPATDLVNETAVSAGDRIDIDVDNSLGGAQAVRPVATLEFYG